MVFRMKGIHIPELICRYMSTLKLVRVRMDQTGNYAATAYNEDAEEKVVFHLEIKGQTSRHTDQTDGEIDRLLIGCLCVCVCVWFSTPKNHIPVRDQQ